MSDVRYFVEEIDVTAVGVGVFIAVGFGFLVVASVCAWERLKKKYDPTPIGQIITFKSEIDGAIGQAILWDHPEGVSADLIIVDDLDPYRDFQFDEREARRMMKKTAKEMDWTKVRWE